MLPESIAVSRYSAYGYRTHAGGGALAFNGERRDPVTGCYHLGNGYRAYNPALMRFQAQDSLSPFGDGGLNGYAYCTGDPINRVDPSGHFDVWGLVLRGFNSLSSGGALAYNFLGQPPDNRVSLNAVRVSTFGSVLSLGSSAALFAGVESAIFGANVGAGINFAAIATRVIYAVVGPGSRPWSQIKTNWNLMTGGLPVAPVSPVSPEFVLEVVNLGGRNRAISVSEPVTYDVNANVNITLRRQLAEVSSIPQAMDIRQAPSLSPRTTR